MQHRHLDNARLSTATVASILERGGASDLHALFTALRRDPHGAAATAALRAAEASEVYGYPDCSARVWKHGAIQNRPRALGTTDRPRR